MTVSKYEPYWLLLLKDGILTIQVRTELVSAIINALSKRKHNHRQRTGIRFSPIRIIKEPATNKAGNPLPTHTRLTLKLHNITVKDL